MAQETVVRHVPLNPCCEQLQNKKSKLSQKLAKSEEGRNFLKKAIGILEEKILNIETENLKLKEELDQERINAKDEREKKIKESASRVTLENEISALKSEISSLKEKSSSESEDVGEKVVILQDRLLEGEKEISLLKEHLEKERINAEKEKMMAQLELKKAYEAQEKAKEDMVRAEKVQADNEREMKMKESTIRSSVEDEISSLRSQISVLQQQAVSGAQDLKKETDLLQETISEQNAEIIRLKELLQKEKHQADFKIKKADKVRKQTDDGKHKAEKLLAEKETELEVKESAVRVSLEDEISSLKSQVRLLQEQAVLGAQDVNKEINFLRDLISVKDTEINRLNELLQVEKQRADSEMKKAEEEMQNLVENKVCAEKLLAEKVREMKLMESAARLPLENEISSLKSQVELLQQQALSGPQDVSKNSGDQDVNKENVLFQARISEREAEINRLKKLLQKQKKRADSEKKKAGTEKCRADKVLAENERELKEKEQAMRLELESQRQLLQQEIAVQYEKKQASHFQSLVSNKEAEIDQLKKLVEKERTRAESEKNKAEAWKKKVNESQKIAKAEKSWADEERRLAAIERKKVEESMLQLEKLRTEVNGSRANLESEALKLQHANEMLEAEKQNVIQGRQHADMEMAKAEEQSKLLETSRREIMEEKARADSLFQQLEEERGTLQRLQKEIAELVSTNAGKDPDDLSVEHVDIEAVKLKRGPHLKVMNRECEASKVALNRLHCEEVIKRLEDVKEEAVREKERADSEMREAEYQRKVAEAYGEKAKLEANRCKKLADELENNKCKTEQLKKEIHNCVSSGTLVNADRKSINTDAATMKLLRKELKLKKVQTKHAKEVASLEKHRNLLLQQEIWRIKEAFSQISNHLDILDKCSSNLDVGINSLKKDTNVSRRQGVKRKFLDEELCQVHHIGNELKSSCSPLDACTFKHHKQCSAPLLSSKDCTESIPGIDSELVPLLRGTKQTLLKTTTLNSSMTSFFDKKLLGSQERGALTVDEFNKLTEGTANLQPSVSGMSDDISRSLYNRKFGLGIGGTYLHSNDSQPVIDVAGNNPTCNEQTGDASRKNLASFDEVDDSDCLKLLCLDNPHDEESYLVAIERPLSPTLPEVGTICGNMMIYKPSPTSDQSLCRGTIGKDSNGRIKLISLINDNMVPSCSPGKDIDSGYLNDNTCGTIPVQLFPEAVPDSRKNLENGKMDYTSEPGNLGRSCTGDKGVNSLSGSNSLLSCHPGYYVVFSNMTSNSSISKIFSATRTCMYQCSMMSQMDHMVQLMSTLSKVEYLLSRELVCVFFSMFVQNYSDFAFDNLKNLADGSMVLSFELLAERVRSEINVEISIFEDLLDLDELLSLIQDFLIHRKVLRHCNVSSDSLHGSDLTGDIVLSSGDVLSFQAASDQQLVGASAVLASLCVAVDHIGFVCETSYNMLRMRKFDSLTLIILHVFAYISGAKFLTNGDHTLSMTVIKSLVTVLEREISSTETSSCRSPSPVHLGFSQCKDCPYSVSAVPIDVAVSMLFEKLHSYILSNVSYEDIRDANVNMNFEALDGNEDIVPGSVYGEIICVQCGNCKVPCCCQKAGISTLSETVSGKTLCYLGDILSLLELVASKMNWSWSFTNIVLKLLDILDSSVSDELVSAIVVLLGQLGRLGVDAHGYDDTRLEALRGRLSSLLCRNASAVMVLPTQIATVTALLGVIPIKFEELYKSNNEVPEVVKECYPADCIRKWFSLLSKKQQSLSVRLLTDGLAS